MLPLGNTSVLLLSSRGGWKNQAKVTVTIFISVIGSGDGGAFPIAMEDTDPLVAPAQVNKEGSDGAEL